LFEAKPREHEREPGQRPFDEQSAQQLLAIGSFDSLVAAVLLAGLSEVIASPELRERALHLYVEIQAPLMRMALMDGTYLELFPLIDSRCKHWVYLSSNQRMDVVIFSQGVAADQTRNDDRARRWRRLCPMASHDARRAFQGFRLESASLCDCLPHSSSRCVSRSMPPMRQGTTCATL
jgi:hypothetical protein